VRKNNQGFTLLELIIIVAIIAVVSGLAAVSLAPILNTAAKQAAVSAKAKIYQCKTDCMAKNADVTCLEFKNDNGYLVATYYQGDLTEAVSSEKLANRKVTLTYGGTKLEDGEKLYLDFEKSSGSVRHFGVAEDVSSASVAGSSTNCTLTVAAGATTYELRLDPVSGVCKLKRQ
jgi:prepilin-type N-terminal cleavage/methylation domain-containing protein